MGCGGFDPVGDNLRTGRRKLLSKEVIGIISDIKSSVRMKAEVVIKITGKCPNI
jgi:hypothetical protein